MFREGVTPEEMGIEEPGEATAETKKKAFLESLLANRDRFFRIAALGSSLCAMLMTGCERKSAVDSDIRLGETKIVLNDHSSITREGGLLHVDQGEHNEYWPEDGRSSSFLSYEASEQYLPAEEFAFAVLKDYRGVLHENKYKIMAEYAGQIADWQFKEGEIAAGQYPEIGMEKPIFEINDSETLIYDKEMVPIDEDHELTDTELRIIAHYLAEIIKHEAKEENDKAPIREGAIGPHTYYSDSGEWHFSQDKDGDYNYEVWPGFINKAFFLYQNDQMRTGNRHSHFTLERTE